ncbi:MAG TPA: ATP-binding protein [Gemmatimonadaceae bacterium]|nr:ATP-binding protein [Gemmatimonadaceae bacterium]
MVLANGTFDAARRDVLEQLAGGASLGTLLDLLARHVEARGDGALCSILLLDAERNVVRHGAAPSLPAEYCRAIDGQPIGPVAGSCGTAAYRGERVIVTDIATDPLWEKYAAFTLPYGLRACWSSPILAPDRTVLGTFAVYYKETRAPTAPEIALIDEATHIAAVVIGTDRMRERVDAEGRLRSLVYANVTDIIFCLGVEADGAFRFLSVNPAFTRATGIPEGDVVGRTVQQIIPEPSLSYVLGRYREAIRTRAAVSWEEVTPYPSGTKYGEVTVAPLFDAAGVCTTLVGTVHDVTARTNAESERRELESQLRQSQRLQSLGTLAGGLAHDFNNILTAIRGYTGVALDELPTGSPGVDCLKEIDRASMRAADLVHRILTFSRHESSQRAEVDFASVVDEALTLVRASLPKKVVIETRFAADTPTILADATQLHQIVINLATNAGHAMRDGGTLTASIDHVTIDARMADAMPDLDERVYARLRVTDTGVGMDRQTLERVFEPFFTTRPAGEGTGLGLAVVHGIVKAHKGAITVDSTPGAGTTFTVYLPAVIATQPSVQESPRRSAPIGRALARLLVVDDDLPLLFLTRRVLKRRQYDVTTHHDAHGALEMFTSSPDSYDAVIADVTMPGMPGIDFARAVLALRPKIPMILVSGYAAPAVVKAAKEMGVRAVITKPYSADQYADLLEPLLK